MAIDEDQLDLDLDLEGMEGGHEFVEFSLVGKEKTTILLNWLLFATFIVVVMWFNLRILRVGTTGIICGDRRCLCWYFCTL